MNGRSKAGSILVRARCAYKNKSYISIDSQRIWSNQQAIIVSIKLKNSNNNYLALIKYANGSMSFTYLPHGLFLGHFINTQLYLNRFYKYITLGKRLPIKNIKRFSIIFNVSITYKGGGCYAQSSGTYCRLVKLYKDYGLALIRLPSKKKYIIS